MKLAIEPLHPMYAADRSCINRMAEARHVCEQLDHPLVGIACDVYHVWWDPDLEAEIARAGEMKTLFGYHVCDWRPDTRHLLTDRGLMGEGCIDLRTIRGWIEATGFTGFNEVEIFSEQYWAMDQQEYLAKIRQALPRARLSNRQSHIILHSLNAVDSLLPHWRSELSGVFVQVVDSGCVDGAIMGRAVCPSGPLQRLSVQARSAVALRRLK